MNGVLIIDKPGGMTSHHIVHRVRKMLREKSVGHLGTLDPMATGVLPLVVGSFTRLAQFYLKSEKTYEGTIRFGFSTDTYDAEGEPASEVQNAHLSLLAIQELAKQYVGVIEQIPPPFSAKKIKGVPAYKLARKQLEVTLKPARVEITEFKILELENDCASFTAHVASGTYIRSLAHDMGQKLGCGAHLSALRRTRVHDFTLAEAHSLDALQLAANKNECDSLFVHPRKFLPEIPSVTATDEALEHIICGRAVNLPDFSQARQVKVFRGQKELVAIATRIAGTLFHPKIVLSQTQAMKVSNHSYS